jgi:glycosyltransferase involved in cell wall biosynthesis
MVEGESASRLLFAVPFPPRLDGDHGGSRTIAHLLAVLAGRHQIGLLYLRSADEPELDPALAARCAWAESVRRGPARADPWRAGRRLRLSAGLLRHRPTWVTRWRVAEYARRLRAISREWEPSLIQLEFHVMGQYLDALADCPAPRVLVEHEPGVAAACDRWEHSTGIGRLVARWDLAAWRRYEPAVLNGVQAAVVFTQRDQAAVEGLASTRVVRIPLGITIGPEPLDPVGAQPPALLFVGNYMHPPNVDAAIRLASGIFPGVRAVIPGVQLHLVGSRPPASLQRLAGDGVVVMGTVPDVTPYLDRAAVVVVPLRLGGGMRVKVLEALAAGKAVVASARAVEGLELVHGRELLLAESDEDFTDGIVRLLSDPISRRALSAHARQWATANLGWERVAAAYESLYRSLLSAMPIP